MPRTVWFVSWKSASWRKYVDAGGVPGSSPKAGGFMAHGSSMDLSLPAVRETLQNLRLKIWPPKTRGYAVKIKSYARPMNF